MSKYIFALAGATSSHNTLLKLGVEYIRSKQSGFGSSWAKGKRYIKANLMCSSNAIKRACVIKSKIFNHDYNEYGTDVYYYHKDYCSLIVKCVLDYIVNNIDDPALPQAFRESSVASLLELTYKHRISQVRWVSVNNYKEQGDDAKKMYIELKNLC